MCVRAFTGTVSPCARTRASPRGPRVGGWRRRGYGGGRVVGGASGTVLRGARRVGRPPLSRSRRPIDRRRTNTVRPAPRATPPCRNAYAWNGTRAPCPQTPARDLNRGPARRAKPANTVTRPVRHLLRTETAVAAATLYGRSSGFPPAPKSVSRFSRGPRPNVSPNRRRRLRTGD